MPLRFQSLPILRVCYRPIRSSLLLCLCKTPMQTTLFALQVEPHVNDLCDSKWLAYMAKVKLLLGPLLKDYLMRFLGLRVPVQDRLCSGNPATRILQTHRETSLNSNTPGMKTHEALDKYLRTDPNTAWRGAQHPQCEIFMFMCPRLPLKLSTPRPASSFRTEELSNNVVSGEASLWMFVQIARACSIGLSTLQIVEETRHLRFRHVQYCHRRLLQAGLQGPLTPSFQASRPMSLTPTHARIWPCAFRRFCYFH